MKNQELHKYIPQCDQIESLALESDLSKYIKVEIPHFFELETRVSKLEKIFVTKNKPSSPYATIHDAKEYLKCSYSKVRRLVDRGFLKKNIDSRHIQILWSSIYAYVETSTSS
jgi:ribosomal protein S20